MWIEAASISQEPRLGYESSEQPMMLPINSYDEPNKHMDA